MWPFRKSPPPKARLTEDEVRRNQQLYQDEVLRTMAERKPALNDIYQQFIKDISSISVKDALLQTERAKRQITESTEKYFDALRAETERPTETGLPVGGYLRTTGKLLKRQKERLYPQNLPQRLQQLQEGPSTPFRYPRSDWVFTPEVRDELVADRYLNMLMKGYTNTGVMPREFLEAYRK